MKLLGWIFMPVLVAGTVAAASVPHNGYFDISNGTSAAIVAYDQSSTAAAITSQNDAIRTFEIADEYLRQSKAYTASMSGKIIAKKGFIKYEQRVTGKIIAREEGCYSCSESSSLLINVKHEAYLRGNSVAYRNDNGAIETASDTQYLDAYGVLPGGIDGHIVNEDTVISSGLVSADNGLLTYRYELDRDRGASSVRKQIKAFGRLKALPEISEPTKLVLTVRADGSPVSLDLTEKYKITFGLLGKVNCTQTLTCTFDRAPSDIPDSASFTAALQSR